MLNKVHHATNDLQSESVFRRQREIAINEAYERLLKSDVKYRFAIDMASLKSE